MDRQAGVIIGHRVPTSAGRVYFDAHSCGLTSKQDIANCVMLRPPDSAKALDTAELA
ncbi:MAG TPA: hypothetical protein VFF64_24490 [Candidatus Eremiobacteraceae bacterium]|nr:hypothetical protein [Candidatus Eremiobacteraceae bacterium]